VGPLAELLEARRVSTEVALAPGASGLPPLPPGARVHGSAEGAIVELGPDADVNAFLAQALGSGCRVLGVEPRKESLEDVFIRQASAGRGA
jgi:ABC-2 type transport system ATP-binding protein